MTLWTHCSSNKCHEISSKTNSWRNVEVSVIAEWKYFAGKFVYTLDLWYNFQSIYLKEFRELVVYDTQNWSNESLYIPVGWGSYNKDCRRVVVYVNGGWQVTHATSSGAESNTSRVSFICRWRRSAPASVRSRRCLIRTTYWLSIRFTCVHYT